MKRVFALILALCMACALFACGKKQTEVAPGGDRPTVTPGATDPGSGPAENPGGSTGVPGGAGSTGNAGNGGNTTGSTGSGWAGTRVAVIYFSCTGSTRTAAPDRGPAAGPVPVWHHLSGLSHLAGHRTTDHQHVPGQL